MPALVVTACSGWIRFQSNWTNATRMRSHRMAAAVAAVPGNTILLALLELAAIGNASERVFTTQSFEPSALPPQVRSSGTRVGSLTDGMQLLPGSFS